MANPVDAYFQDKTAAKEQRKADELKLWEKWMSGGQQPKHLQPLLKLYAPVLGQKVRQWKAPTVPQAAFHAELTTHLIKAFQNYDPNRGAALNTHVEKRLKKAMRYNNRFANLAYIPEGQSGQIGKIQKARDTLTEDLGRMPTTDELAQHLGMTPKRVGTILDAVKRAVPMSHSGDEDTYDYALGGEGVGRGFEDQQIAVAQHILPKIFPNKPEFHTLFNYTFGTNDHPKITSTTALAKKMGKSDSQISRMKTQMGNTLKRHMGLEDDDD